MSPERQPGEGLSELALFEVADIASAASLAARLATRWSVFVSADRSDSVTVGAGVWRGPGDLALLLREVEAWLDEESLCALRFELDGRTYVLEAGKPDWSVEVAPFAQAESQGRRSRLLKALATIERALAPGGRAVRIRGLESLRQNISLALRLDDESL